jgi:amino acid permease
MVWAFSAAEQCSSIALGLRYIGETSQSSPKLLDSRRPSEQGSPVLRSWGCLVEVAFGRRARCAMNVFLIVETWGYLLSYIVGAGMNLSEMLGDTYEHKPVGIMISVIFAYVISAYPLRRLTRLNLISGFMTMVCMGLFIISGLMLPERAPAAELQVFNLPGLISAAGILVFSPAAHAFYPDIMARMEEPQLYTSCLRRSYAVACILYLVVGVTGYMLFGQAAQDSLIQNIGLDRALQPLPGTSWMAIVAASGMGFRFLVLQAYVLPTLTSSVESLTGIASNTSRSIVLALSAGIAAVFAKKAALLLNLLGSAVCINIAFTVPVLCYWRLSRRARILPFYEQALLSALLIMGISFSVLGVVSCVSS